MPNIKGLKPTALMLFIDSDEPIRNSVTTSNDFDIAVIYGEIMPTIGINVLPSIVSINKPINHGIETRPLLLLNRKIESNDTGIIHRARASFTVVATSNASCPYADAAPTTELVS